MLLSGMKKQTCLASFTFLKCGDHDPKYQIYINACDHLVLVTSGLLGFNRKLATRALQSQCLYVGSRAKEPKSQCVYFMNKTKITCKKNLCVLLLEKT